MGDAGPVGHILHSGGKVSGKSAPEVNVLDPTMLPSRSRSATMDDIVRTLDAPHLFPLSPLIRRNGNVSRLFNCTVNQPFFLFVILCARAYARQTRTKNAKRTSQMPLAGLCAARGRGDCPELVHARTDRCFALVRSGSFSNSTPEGDDGDQTKGSEFKKGWTVDGGRRVARPGRRRWGTGGNFPPRLTHEKRWRGGSGTSTTGRLGASGEKSTALRPGERERLGIETASVEECDTLVAEINELVRRANLKKRGLSPGERELADACHPWPSVRPDDSVGFSVGAARVKA